MKTRRLAWFAVACLPVAARADVLHVPSDFPTVAEALVAAQPGDEVVLAAGVYGNPILLDGHAGIVLRGQGQVILSGGDALTAALTVTDCDDVRIEHLRIVGPAGDGVFVGQCNGVTLSRLRIEDAGATGILAGESSNLLIERCRIDGAGQDGIELLLAADCSVSRCTVTATAGHGIALSDLADCEVERCRVSDPLGSGIVLGASDPVTHCRADRNVVLRALSSPGIRALGTGNVVTGCVVRESESSGLQFFEPSTGGLMQGNRVFDCEFGIFSRATGALLADNRVVRVTDAGIASAGDASVLSGNVVRQALRGIEIQSGMTSGSVIACRTLDSGDFGFDISSSGVTFTGNTSVDASLAGFMVFGDDNTFVGNASKGSGAGLQDDGSGNIYLDNDFDDP